MKVEHFQEEQVQNIEKNAGVCSYLIDMADNSAMEDVLDSSKDDEEDYATDLSELEDLEAERRKLNAKLEFLDVMLQSVKEEERLRRLSGLPGNTPSYLMGEHGQSQFDNDYCENLANPVSNILPSDVYSVEHPLFSAYGQVKTHSSANLNVDVSFPGTENNTVKNSGRSTTSLTAVVPKLDLSTARSDISLDNLSIKELHDTFRATFGRETSVKDKQWLKRRISMGLANKKAKNQENINSRHQQTPSKQFPTYSAQIQASKSKLVVDSKDIQTATRRPLGNNSYTTFFTDKVTKAELGMSNDEVMLGEEITGKRMRKPTKRYIEELSETDARLNNGKQPITHRDSDEGYAAVKSHSRRYHNGFERMTLVCRDDSFGGSGIQVPFVFRVRRGRPRKNSSALLKHKSSERATKLVKKAIRVQATRCSSDNAEMKQIVPFGSTQNFVHDDNENKEHILVSVPADRKYVAKLSNSDSVDDNTDNYVSTIRTAKGGIRRKHHRSWTLQEVVKLVEGVSHFGVGRWSDIKKLAFSSSGYRTSVDLKDKWRNLLRASYAQLQTKKESVNRRKHTSVPIPASILGRVRELSAMQPRALCLPSSSNSTGRSGRIVHKRHPM